MTTLAQFVEELPAVAQAFAAASRREAETDETFSLPRTLDDWFREMAAWAELVELDEILRRTRG